MGRRTGAPADRRTAAPAPAVGSAGRAWAWGRPTTVGLCVGASVLLLAACGKARPDATAAVEAVADTADQVMFGLKQNVTQDGVRKAFLESDTAFLYENAGRADLRNVRVTFFGTAGDTSSVVTGKLGSYEWRTGKMEAHDDVVVLLSNGGRLNTSVLRYDQAKNEVSTDQHYTYVGPDQNATGEGFVTDPTLAKFRTSHARGRAGSFRLPGQ